MRRARWLVPVLLCIGAAAPVRGGQERAGASESRAIRPEDIMGLTDVHDAEIAPDGRQVLYVTQPTISTQRPSRSTIWIVASDGASPARRLTVSAGLDDAPQWSPDGARVAFLSNRPGSSLRGIAGFDQRPASGDPDQPGRGEAAPRDLSAGAEPSRQLWLISPGGGEAQQLTAFGRDIRSFRWSPDGRSIAFLAPDPLSAHARAERRAKRDWVEVDAPQDLTRVWVLDMATRALRRIAIADRDVTELNWSPDGTRLALRTAPTAGLNDFFYHSDLLVADARTGAVERTLFKGVYGAGSWSPDGRRLAFTAPEDDTVGIRAYVADVPSGTLRQLGATLDGTIRRFHWTRNGRLLARTTVHTRSQLAEVDLATGRFRTTLAFDGAIKDLSVADDGSVALAGTQAGRAADVWVFRRGRLRPVTDVNPQVRGWRLGKVEEVRWISSRDGTAIYGVLVTPPDLSVGVPTRTVVQVHGGPEANWSAGWLGSWADWAQLLAAHGYVVLLPNPRGSDGQGTAFARGVKAGWGTSDYQDIVDGVDMLVKRGITDPARMGIGGWSYGGYMSAWAATHDTRFKAAVVGAGITDPLNLGLATDTPDWFAGYFGKPPSSIAKADAASPIRSVDAVRVPVLLLHGQDDRRVPLTQALAFHRGLRMMGKQAQLVTYPREPHWLFEPEHQADVQRRMLAWYDAHL